MLANALNLIEHLPSIPLLLVGQENGHLVEYAARLLCRELDIKEMVHPDLMVLTPQDHTYSMERLHQFIEQVAYPPYQASYRYFVLHEVEKMQPVHMNALLKTLEELPSSHRILMTTTAHQQLLPTLLSRLMVFHLPMMEEKIKNPLIEAFFVALLTDHIGNHIADSAEKIEEAMKKNKLSHQDLIHELTLYLYDYRFVCDHLDEKLSYPHLRSFFAHHRYPEKLFPIQRWLKALCSLEESLKAHLRAKVALEAFALSLNFF